MKWNTLIIIVYINMLNVELCVASSMKFSIQKQAFIISLFLSNLFRQMKSLASRSSHVSREGITYTTECKPE